MSVAEVWGARPDEVARRQLLTLAALAGREAREAPVRPASDPR